MGGGGLNSGLQVSVGKAIASLARYLGGRSPFVICLVKTYFGQHTSGWMPTLRKGAPWSTLAGTGTMVNLR